MTTENDPKAAAPPDTAAETANEYDVPAEDGPDPTDGERAAATEEPAAELTFEEQLKAATDEAPAAATEAPADDAEAPAEATEAADGEATSEEDD